MTLRERISRREMVRRFALGELGSSVFSSAGSGDARALRLMLESSDDAVQDEGMEALYARRPWLREWPPLETRWYLASLSVTEDEFRLLATLPVERWTTYTR